MITIELRKCLQDTRCAESGNIRTHFDNILMMRDIFVPRLASSSRIIHMLSKWVRMLPLSAHLVSCKHFRNSMVIIRDHRSKSNLRVSHASFTVSFPFIFKYKESGIIEAICWNTMACSCKYWFRSFVYFLTMPTCSVVKAAVPAGGDGRSVGFVVVPSRWPYSPLLSRHMLV